MKHENGKDHVYNVFKAWQRLRKEHGAGQPLLRLEVFEEVAILNSIRPRPRLYLFLPHTGFFPQVAPTKQVQKKTCIQLAEKLQNTSELVVGLEYIIEIIACSSEEEPYYECDLCPSKGQANMMYNHLLGKDHKRNVLKKKKPHIIDDNPRKIMKELEEFRYLPRINLILDHECLCLDKLWIGLNYEYFCFSRQTDWAKIQRIYSDEIYPWEAGKAPWSVEQGGTGTMPSGVKDKIKFRVVPGKGSGPGTYYSSFTCYFPSHDTLVRWKERQSIIYV